MTMAVFSLIAEYLGNQVSRRLVGQCNVATFCIHRSYAQTVPCAPLAQAMPPPTLWIPLKLAVVLDSLDHPLRVRRTNRAKTKMKGKERMAVILLQAVPESLHQLHQLMNGQARNYSHEQINCRSALQSLTGFGMCGRLTRNYPPSTSGLVL